jgi:hypothetical protein
LSSKDAMVLMLLSFDVIAVDAVNAVADAVEDAVDVAASVSRC